MIKSIRLNGNIVEYSLVRNSRSKGIRIIIKSDSSMKVSIPSSINFSFLENFIHEKSKWILDKIKSFKDNTNPAFPIRKTKKEIELEYKMNKNKALDIAKNRLEYFNKFYKFTYKKISIRNQKTRWGSCSRNGNLSFNYKIALIPPILADYVIVHELCHLGQFNHSDRFWDLVEQSIPNWKELRGELRRMKF